MKKALLIIGSALLVGLAIYFITRVEKLNSKSIEFLSAVPDNAFLVIGSNDIQNTFLKLNETSSVWDDVKKNKQVTNVYNEAVDFISLFNIESALKFAIIYSGNKKNSNSVFLMSNSELKASTAQFDKTFNNISFQEIKGDSTSFYIYMFKDFIYGSKNESSIQNIITTVKSNGFISAKSIGETSIRKSTSKDFYILTRSSLGEKDKAASWMYYDGEVTINDISLIAGYNTKELFSAENISLTSVLPIKYNYQVEAINDTTFFASEVARVSNALGHALVFRLSKSIKYTTLEDYLKIDTSNAQKFWIKSQEFNYFYNNDWLRSDTLFGSEDIDFAVISENEQLASSIAFELRNQTFESEENLTKASLVNTFNNDSKAGLLSTLNASNLIYSHKYYYSPQEKLSIEKIDIQLPIKSEQINKEYLWQKSIEGGIAQGPFIIKNHRTNNLEILVVDNNNQLKLFGINGELKWTKAIGGKIIGNVEQVDILNNKKLQIIFNTNSKLFLLDILGRDVDGFPIKFNESITNQVSAIDYDGSKNYRFFLAAEKELLAFDKNGKKVSGFKFILKDSKVKSPVQHVLLSGKDYIMFNDSKGKIFFLNRKGEERYNSSSRTKNPNVFESLNLAQSISTSALYDVDSLGRIVEIKLAEKASIKVKDSSVTSKIIISELIKGKKTIIGIKDREVAIYNKTADKLSEIACDFMPKHAHAYYKNGKLDKLLVQSVNDELFVYNFVTSFFEKSYYGISSISSIHDFDGNGKLNFIAVQNNKLTCFELD